MATPAESFTPDAEYDPTAYGDSIADDYDDMYEPSMTPMVRSLSSPIWRRAVRCWSLG